MNERDRFYLIFFMTLLFGTGLVWPDTHLLPLYAGTYGLSLGLRLLVGLGDDYFVSVDKNRFGSLGPEVIIAGKELPLMDESDRREEHFLRNFEMKTIAKRRVGEVLYASLAVFALFYHQMFDLSLAGLLPLICGYLIIASTYVGHLFLPLALNACGVIFSFGISASVQKTAVLPLYILLVFTTFRFISDLSGSQLRLKSFRQLLILSLLFSGVLVALARVLPNPEVEDEKARELTATSTSALKGRRLSIESQIAALEQFPGAKALALRQALIMHAATLGELERTLGPTDFSPERSVATQHKFSELQALDREYDAAFQETTSESDQTAPNEVISGLLDRTSGIYGRAQDLMGKMEGIQEQLKSVRSEDALQGTGPSVQQADLAAKALALKEEFEKTVSLSPRELTELASYVDEKKNELTGLEQGGGMLKNLGDQRQAIEALDRLSQKTNFSPTELSEVGKALQKTQELTELKETLRRDRTALASKHQVLELPDPVKPPRNGVRRFIPLLLLVALVAVIMFILKRRGIRKVEVEEEDLREVSEKLKKLRSLRLSPREEVIHYYNLLHDLLQKVHYPGKETPPSCIVHDELSELYPKLGDATFVVTETFARCFYGERDVSNLELQGFRKALRAIFTVHGLRP